MRFLSRFKICLQFFFLFFFLDFSFSIHAGNNSQLVDATNLGRINVTEGGLIEGEHIDLRTGNVYWETTDLVIPGNGKMDIAVSRSFNKTAFPTYMEFWNWQLESPRIINALDGPPFTAGEEYAFEGGVCGEPRAAGSDFFWSGLILVIPGDSPRELFFRDVNAKQFPESVKYVTTDNWIVECRASERLKAFLQSTNAAYKEKHRNDTDVFLVTAPDGRRFWLDVIERQRGISSQVGLGIVSPSWVINKASWVEDVHGNRLEYRYGMVRALGVNWEGRPLYDELYRLQKITASDGRTVDFFYDESGHILQKITANGKTWQYRCVWSIGLTKVTRPDGHIWQYKYRKPRVFSYGNLKAPFRLSQIKTPSEATIDYTTQQISAGHFLGIDSPYQIPVLATRTVKGPNLKEATWNYRFSNRDNFTVTTVETPEHKEVHEFYRTTNWRLGLLYSRSISNRGSSAPLRQEIYEWTQGPALGDSRIPRGQAHLFLNQGIQKHLVKRIVDEKHTTQYQDHDIYGNPQKIIETGTDTKATQRSYFNSTSSECWLIGLSKDEHIEGGGSTLREYDEKGNLTKQTEYGITTTFDYHPTGDLKSKTQQGQTTFFDNYHRGQAQTISKPENVILRKTINDTGTVASETDGEGHTTSYAYDALNRPIQITPPIQVPTAIEWKIPGTKITTQGRYQETTTLDALEHPIVKDKLDTHSNEHIITKTEYDGEGRVIYQSDPFSSQHSETGTKTTLDGLGRPIQVTHTGDGSTTAYAYEGDKVLITRPNGFKTQTRYRIFGDPKNRGLLEINEQITKEAWKTTTLTRDKLGNLTSVKQGPVTRLFQYDPSRPKLLQKQFDPEIGWINYAYDAAGNKTSEALEGKEAIKYSYDGLNRLVEIDYPKETPDVFYIYDKNDHLTELKKGQTTWLYAYNARGQLTEEKLEVPTFEKEGLGGIFQISHSYDSEGNLENLTYPTGTTLSYQPNAFGRPTQLSEYAKDIGYFPDGQLKTFRIQNGLLTQLTQNKRHWPEKIITQKDGKPLVTQIYQYDFDANLAETQIQNNTQTFTYDGLNQLTAAKGPWGEASFQYDSTGNLIQKNIGKEQLTYSYSPDQNRLTKITGSQNKEFIYDDQGNLSVKGKELFSFDEARNLTALLGSTTKTLYQYDGNNHRTTIQRGKEATYTIHNQAGQLLVEYSPNQTKTYLYHNHQLIARIDKTGNQEAIHYYHTDILGSPIAQSDSKGNLDWQETYAPYGKRLLQQGKDNSQWYTGKTEDNETGFIYLNARYYDPEIARFISPDPIHFTEENSLSFNRYLYANNNPYLYKDPQGTFADFFWDLFSLAFSVFDFIQNPSWMSFGCIAYDATATLIPGLPGGMGAAKYAGKGMIGREGTGFLGRSGFELGNAPYQNVRNEATTISGRSYSGHSLDQMQNRGVMPSVVENTINAGQTFPTRPGTTGYYDPINNMRVIVNSKTGQVVTTIPGAP